VGITAQFARNERERTLFEGLNTALHSAGETTRN
jgi:hypothetical protein